MSTGASRSPHANTQIGRSQDITVCCKIRLSKKMDHRRPSYILVSRFRAENKYIQPCAAVVLNIFTLHVTSTCRASQYISTTVFFCRFIP